MLLNENNIRASVEIERKRIGKLKIFSCDKLKRSRSKACRKLLEGRKVWCGLLLKLFKLEVRMKEGRKEGKKKRKKEKNKRREETKKLKSEDWMPFLVFYL